MKVSPASVGEMPALAVRGTAGAESMGGQGVSPTLAADDSRPSDAEAHMQTVESGASNATLAAPVAAVTTAEAETPTAAMTSAEATGDAAQAIPMEFEAEPTMTPWTVATTATTDATATATTTATTATATTTEAPAAADVAAATGEVAASTMSTLAAPLPPPPTIPMDIKTRSDAVGLGDVAGGPAPQAAVPPFLGPARADSEPANPAPPPSPSPPAPTLTTQPAGPAHPPSLSPPAPTLAVDTGAAAARSPSSAHAHHVDPFSGRVGALLKAASEATDLMGMLEPLKTIVLSCERGAGAPLPASPDAPQAVASPLPLPRRLRIAVPIHGLAAAPAAPPLRWHAGDDQALR